MKQIPHILYEYGDRNKGRSVSRQWLYDHIWRETEPHTQDPLRLQWNKSVLDPSELHRQL